MTKAFQWSGEREQLLLKNAKQLSYETLGDGRELVVYLYLPPEPSEGGSHPGFLFFNSGAWDRGSVIQFAPQALYYVGRGAICGLVEYRNRGSHPGSCPIDALRDGRSAIHTLRQHAASLHLDPTRVVVVGGGAGANIAAGAAMGIPLPGCDPALNAATARPDAAILFSAILDIEKGGYGYDSFSDEAEARLASLSRHVNTGSPPLLLLHGTADRLVPLEDAAEFADKMKRHHNVCELAEFEGRDGNFYNFNVDPVSYEASLATMDDFLDRHGLLMKGENHEGPQIISWREQDY